MRDVKFNVNDFVSVRLTDRGRDVHRNKHAALMQHMRPSAREDFPYQPPQEDANGWSRWQLWDLMATFGPHMWLGGDNCFETSIRFEANDL